MPSFRKSIIFRTFISSLGAIVVFVILLLHNAWGDDRYVLRDEARIEEIARIDTQLAIKDTEILFAESDAEKEKLRAIKEIYERQKEALREKRKDKG